MGKSAYIKMVDGSKKQSLTIDDLKQILHQFVERAKRNGQQLGWPYELAAFPYEIKQKPEARDWFYLKGKERNYRYIIFGVQTERVEVRKEVPKTGGEKGEKETIVQQVERSTIQVVLPDGHTQGDSNKASELCKFIAKQLDAELILFNGRILYPEMTKPSL
jgi:hypothetical protein